MFPQNALQCSLLSASVSTSQAAYVCKLLDTWNDCLFAPDGSWKAFKRAFTYKFASHLMKNVAKKIKGSG